MLFISAILQSESDLYGVTTIDLAEVVRYLRTEILDFHSKRHVLLRASQHHLIFDIAMIVAGASLPHEHRY